MAYGLWSFLPDTWRPARWPVSIVAGLMVGLHVATKVTLPDFGTERAFLEHRDAGELARQDLTRARMAIYASAFHADVSEHLDAMSAEEARNALSEVGAHLRARFGEADIASITARQPPAPGRDGSDWD